MKNDVAAELPPKLETELPCPLNDEQRKAYRALADGGLQEHGNDLHEAIRQSSMHVFSPCLQGCVKRAVTSVFFPAGSIYPQAEQKAIY